MENCEQNISLGDLIGESQFIDDLKKRIKLVAPTDANVLILGERGTGKTLIGNIIHNLHPERKLYPLGQVVAAEVLPGYETFPIYDHSKHNFAETTPKPDLINFECQNGSLFIDGIDTASPEFQIMLLNLLEAPLDTISSMKYVKKINIRVIASSMYSSDELQCLGSFRRDLYLKISEYVIESIPLRERKEDIKPLAYHFIMANNDKIRCTPITMENGEVSEKLPKLEDIEPEALKKLEGYNWPGNVRELEQVIRSAMVESLKHPKVTTLKAEWTKLPTY